MLPAKKLLIIGWLDQLTVAEVMSAGFPLTKLSPHTLASPYALLRLTLINHKARRSLVSCLRLVSMPSLNAGNRKKETPPFAPRSLRLMQPLTQQITILRERQHFKLSRRTLLNCLLARITVFSIYLRKFCQHLKAEVHGQNDTIISTQNNVILLAVVTWWSLTNTAGTQSKSSYKLFYFIFSVSADNCHRVYANLS